MDSEGEQFREGDELPLDWNDPESQRSQQYQDHFMENQLNESQLDEPQLDETQPVESMDHNPTPKVEEMAHLPIEQFPPSLYDATPEVPDSYENTPRLMAFDESLFQSSYAPEASVPTGNETVKTDSKNNGSKTGAVLKSTSPNPNRGIVPNLVHQESASNMDTSGGDDDDEDIIIVDKDQASQEAQRRWATRRQPVVAEDDEGMTSIKQEPLSSSGPTTPKPVKDKGKGRAVPSPHLAALSKAEMLAAQKTMLKRVLEQRGSSFVSSSSSSRTGNIFRPRKTTVNAESHPSKRHRSNLIPTSMNELADAAMAPPEDADDDAWMHEENDGDDEYDNLKELRDALKQKGKLDQEEMRELLQTEERITVIERLRDIGREDHEADDNEGERNSLFIPESLRRRHIQDRPNRQNDSGDRSRSDNHSPSHSHSRSDDERQPHRAELNHEQDYDEDAAFARMLQGELDGDNAGPSSSSSKGKKKANSKPRKKPAKDAREIVRRQEDERREKERKKAQRKKSHKDKGKGVSVSGKSAAGSSRPKGSQNKGKGKAAASSSRNKGPGDKVKRSKNLMSRAANMDDTTRHMLADLMHNDQIADRVAHGYDPQPEILAKNKSSQLEQIIASVPKNLGDRQKGHEKQDILNASKAFGYAKVKAVNGKWLCRGMKSSLYHHQLLGARFMLERELSKNLPAGGINADQMGLGKTVQMLATMVGNPPTEQDKRQNLKTTLLVVPSAVIDQWQAEIRKHVKEHIFPRVMHYKASKKIPIITLQDQDILITSYHEVMNSYPYPDAEAFKKIGAGGLSKWLHDADELKGDLHKIHFYRIVLDEAHACKSHQTRTSLACQRLQGVYRWCLTGTPIMNRLEELYAALRFLRVPYTNSFAEFQSWFCDPDSYDCQARIAALLSFTMIRRNMNTKLLGRPIVSLKDPHPEIQFVQFLREERIIYRITENRFRQSINAHFQRGSEQRNYGHYMVQLLRLRQCTSHPFMLEQTIKECWNAEDLQVLKRKLKSINSNNSIPLYEQCKVWFNEATVLSDPSAAANGSANDGGVSHPGGVGNQDGESLPFGKGKYGHSFKINKYLNGNFLKNTAGPGTKDFLDRVICALCSDVPREPQITDCTHIFCKDCLMGYMHERIALADGDVTYFECPSCQLVFNDTHPYDNSDVLFPDDDNPSPQDGDASGTQSPQAGASQPGSSRRAGPQKEIQTGRDALGFEPATLPSLWLSQSDHGANSMPLLPSAKTMALKAKLLKWFDDAPNDKVVIFTQFRLLARIVGRIATSERWNFLYYTGDASDQHRTKVINKFSTDPTINLLIAGLKCGGQGLNLTAANRCISLDLWWNHAVEQQAFGRTFRLGQEKETYFTRICVRNTVEQRMLAMQADKLKIIERMMHEGENTKMPQLDIKELASLFGYLNEGEDGKLWLSEDYLDEEQEVDEGQGEGSA